MDNNHFPVLYLFWLLYPEMPKVSRNWSHVCGIHQKWRKYNTYSKLPEWGLCTLWKWINWGGYLQKWGRSSGKEVQSKKKELCEEKNWFWRVICCVSWPKCKLGDGETFSFVPQLVFVLSYTLNVWICIVQ